MNDHPYIGFEGPIAAGKTTLSKLLAAHLRAKLILEDVDGNEFLADFYDDRDRWALQMQLWFLTARHRQLTSMLSDDTCPIVGDYTFAKDSIFAHALLKDSELRLYQRIAAGLRVLRRPVLMVYLDANDEVLIRRIAGRNRPYEKNITSEYLDSLRDAYEVYLATGAEKNVLRIDTTSLDLKSSSQLNDLYRRILERCTPGNGRHLRSRRRE
jgi:deoxyguanosine kinase